ncbi:MAG: RDD family protein [Thiohalocapsa sp. PB-PSB1]|jgi:uncharacterized RDD family membrane protein YckC|nr:MAG: hypothetical protein N838_05160 [Thiohalocapsa sp. PB-PSB1]QQO56883.1 MAG: RDD family protein [Thiohalocapsa sp. PB-PSB1]
MASNRLGNSTGIGITGFGAPADADGESLIDTLRVFETPEGVDLALRLAGPAPRAAALAMDWGIRLVLYLLLTPMLALSGFGVGLYLLALFLMEWFYPVFFELRSGATPGKKAMGLVVVHDDGTPIGPSASVIRNLLRAVDFLPMLYAAGLVSMLLDRDFRRLGDLAAGTLVIYADKPTANRHIPEHKPLAPVERLDTEQQQAILDLAERSTRLSRARCAELAELIVGAQGARGEAAVSEVLGIANWIARGR